MAPGAREQLHEGLLEAPRPGAHPQLLGRATREYRARTDHHHLIAQRAHLLHDVAGEQHAVPGIPQLPQQQAPPLRRLQEPAYQQALPRPWA